MMVTMAAILVVEDEKDIQDVVAYNLRQAGHSVLTANSGLEALAQLRAHAPDLVVLDLMLPGMPGTDVCRSIKQTPATAHIPVIMLTAKGDEIDRVVGFELGADDYVVKPFSVRELILRISAILRRAPGEATPGTDTQSEFGILRIGRESHRVWVEDREVVLTSLEFKLLCTIFDRRDRVQSRATLLDDVWDMSGEMLTRTVDTHVKRLREKLGAAGIYIETVRGAGYRFCGSPDLVTP